MSNSRKFVKVSGYRQRPPARIRRKSLASELPCPRLANTKFPAACLWKGGTGNRSREMRSCLIIKKKRPSGCSIWKRIHVRAFWTISCLWKGGTGNRSREMRSCLIKKKKRPSGCSIWKRIHVRAFWTISKREDVVAREIPARQLRL